MPSSVMEEEIFSCHLCLFAFFEPLPPQEGLESYGKRAQVFNIYLNSLFYVRKIDQKTDV